jgi:hypothetical protein
MRDALNHLKQRAFLAEAGDLVGDAVLVPGDARQVVVRRVIEPEAGDAFEVALRAMARRDALGVFSDHSGEGGMAGPYSDCC